MFCFVLFCFVLFCFVLFCFVLFCFVLFCFVLFCFVLFCFVLFCFVLFCFVYAKAGRETSENKYRLCIDPSCHSCEKCTYYILYIPFYSHKRKLRAAKASGRFVDKHVYMYKIYKHVYMYKICWFVSIANSVKNILTFASFLERLPRPVLYIDDTWYQFTCL